MKKVAQSPVLTVKYIPDGTKKARRKARFGHRTESNAGSPNMYTNYPAGQANIEQASWPVDE